MVATTEAVRRQLQSNNHHQQTNTQLYKGQMPFLLPNQQCRSTEGKNYDCSYHLLIFPIYCYPLIIIISGLHRYECVAPLVANSLQSGQFWARSTASVHDSPRVSRSFCTVFIQVIRGRPGGLFQYTEGEEVKICLTSTLSSIRAICPIRVRCHAWIISVSRGWSVWRLTSSLQMK